MTESDSACQCGHSREAHEHYRKGSDCGICGRATCASFRVDLTSGVAADPQPSAPVFDDPLHRRAAGG
jgi:hypothetical protein